MKLSAAAIYQHNLDVVSHALWVGDLALMLRHIALPNQMLTQDAEIVITSADEMLILMTEFREVLRNLGADHYMRVCLGASFLSPAGDIIVGQHNAYILRQGTLLRPVYANDMTLILGTDGQWRGVRIEARACNTDYPILSPDMAADQRRALQRLYRPPVAATQFKDEDS